MLSNLTTIIYSLTLVDNYLLLLIVTIISDCTQAYPLESKYGLRQACEEGCQNQMEECARQPHRFSDNTVEVKDNATKSEIGADESGKVWNLGTPVLQVRKVMAQVVGQFHVLRTSIMTYFLQDDNTLIAVQSQPQVRWCSLD